MLRVPRLYFVLSLLLLAVLTLSLIRRSRNRERTQFNYMSEQLRFELTKIEISVRPVSKLEYIYPFIPLPVGIYIPISHFIAKPQGIRKGVVSYLFLYQTRKGGFTTIEIIYRPISQTIFRR